MQIHKKKINAWMDERDVLSSRFLSNYSHLVCNKKIVKNRLLIMYFLRIVTVFALVKLLQRKKKIRFNLTTGVVW
jgi:hypothetical protein